MTLSLQTSIQTCERRSPTPNSTSKLGLGSGELEQGVGVGEVFLRISNPKRFNAELRGKKPDLYWSITCCTAANWLQCSALEPKRDAERPQGRSNAERRNEMICNMYLTTTGKKPDLTGFCENYRIIWVSYSKFVSNNDT
jgi:hypothetical protein